MRILALAMVAGLFAGCAATPMIQDDIRSDLSPYTTVEVIIERDAAVVDAHGYDATANELATMMVDNIRAGGKAALRGPMPAEGRVLQAKVLIRSLSYVSGAGRALGGIMAGRAAIAVTLTLTDKQTNAVLGTANAQHTSSHGQGAFSPTTSRQVEAIAKEFAARITRR